MKKRKQFAVGDLVLLRPLIAGGDAAGEGSPAIIIAIDGNTDEGGYSYYWVLDHKGNNRPVHRGWVSMRMEG